MAIVFDETDGPIGPIGLTGDIGGTGPTGPAYHTSGTGMSDGVMSHFDKRLIRKVVHCNCGTQYTTERASGSYSFSMEPRVIGTSGLGVITAPYWNGSFRGVLLIATFYWPFTFQGHIYFSVPTNDTGQYVYTHSVYINGSVTSSDNPLMWQRGSVLAFYYTGSNRFNFVKYLGNNYDSTYPHDMPLLHFDSTPSSFPVQPCLYQVGSSSTIQYRKGTE